MTKPETIFGHAVSEWTRIPDGERFNPDDFDVHRSDCRKVYEERREDGATQIIVQVTNQRTGKLESYRNME